MQRKRTLVVGGSALDARSPVMERYLVGLTGKQRPNVCFLPTASADSDASIIRFLTAFEAVGAHPAFLKLFNRTIDDLADYLLGFDLIYLGGGNTGNMMAIWKDQGVDRILKKAWRRGTIIAGGSAGAICWYESGITDTTAQIKEPIKPCYGILKGSHCPHYHWKNWREVYLRLIAERKLPGGIALDDRVAIRYDGSEIADIVSTDPESFAWLVRLDKGRVREKRLSPRLLTIE